MADTQSTIALNIGSQRISMAVFEPAKSGGLVLKAYDSEVILADPATEPARASQVAQALNTLSQRMKVKNSKIRYAISGQSVITRFVKLPPLDDDNIEQLVTFEAQQQVPFPLDEVVWDYEVLEGDGEKEVVIVAIKGDALEELNESVNDAGMGTTEVDVAPMALYNAYRASNPVSADPVLLIDIGAKSTDLLYIEGKRFFTRSINRAGVMVTSAIAKEYGVSFADAESHKTQGGMVALGGGHTTELDETAAALAMTIRNSLSQLPAEITRTNNYYRSQHGGSPPKSIVIAGGGASLPYTKEFLEEKLHLPVTFFNPLGIVSLGKNVDSGKVSKEAHMMGELVGLGLRGIGKSIVNIDLVPAKVQASRDSDKRKPFLIGASALFLVGLAAWAGLTSSAASSLDKKTKELTEQQSALSEFAQPIDAALKKQAGLEATAKPYTDSEADRTFWLGALQEVKAAFASDSAWISEMEPLVGYNPFTKDKLHPVVKSDFIGVVYGQSPMDINLKGATDAAPAAAKNAAAAPAGPATANALRLHGYWRKSPSNPANQTIVYNMLKRLRDKPEHFKFTAVRPPDAPVDAKKGKAAPAPAAGKGAEGPAEVSDQDLVKKLVSEIPNGDYAAEFEVIIPLSREVQVK